MNHKIERHGEFVAQLGDRLLGRYTDGGAGLKRIHREKLRHVEQLGLGGSFARSVRRKPQKKV